MSALIRYLDYHYLEDQTRHGARLFSHEARGKHHRCRLVILNRKIAEKSRGVPFRVPFQRDVCLGCPVYQNERGQIFEGDLLVSLLWEGFTDDAVQFRKTLKSEYAESSEEFLRFLSDVYKPYCLRCIGEDAWNISRAAASRRSMICVELQRRIDGRVKNGGGLNGNARLLGASNINPLTINNNNNNAIKKSLIQALEALKGLDLHRSKRLLSHSSNMPPKVDHAKAGPSKMEKSNTTTTPNAQRAKLSLSKAPIPRKLDPSVCPLLTSLSLRSEINRGSLLRMPQIRP